MKGLDLSRFNCIHQTRWDFCLLACIENMIKYIDPTFNYDQNEIDKKFRAIINPKSDHPYFYHFALNLEKVFPKYQGIYNSHLKVDSFLDYIKQNLDKDLPVMISLKTNSDLAHIVIVCNYDANSISYYDPNPNLKNSFVEVTLSSINSMLRGSKPDTLVILLR